MLEGLSRSQSEIRPECKGVLQKIHGILPFLRDRVLAMSTSCLLREGVPYTRELSLAQRLLVCPVLGNATGNVIATQNLEQHNSQRVSPGIRSVDRMRVPSGGLRSPSGGMKPSVQPHDLMEATGQHGPGRWLIRRHRAWHSCCLQMQLFQRVFMNVLVERQGRRSGHSPCLPLTVSEQLLSPWWSQLPLQAYYIAVPSQKFL